MAIDHRTATAMDRSKLFDLKENLIKYSEEKYSLGFFDDVRYSNITESSILDPVAIEADGGFQAIAYFDTNPDSFSARATEEENERLWIEQELTPALKIPDWHKAIEGLIEEELKETDLPRKKWKGKNLGTKVTLFSALVTLADKFVGLLLGTISHGARDHPSDQTPSLPDKFEEVRV
jgi:hypothetical protein